MKRSRDGLPTLVKSHEDRLVGKTVIQKYADDQHSLLASVEFESGAITKVVFERRYKDMHAGLAVISLDYLPALVEVLRELIDVLERADQ